MRSPVRATTLRRTAAATVLAAGLVIVAADPATANTRLDNPYAGARVYVDPEWSARAAAGGGAAVADRPTAIWLDRIAAIEDGAGAMGLRAHLDAALAQDADVIQLVLHNLPGRNCAALASYGELAPSEIGRYRTEFIDPIAEILADPAYADLRIVTIIEPDSLPHLVTSVSTRPTYAEGCNQVRAGGNYLRGVGYALARLGELPNVYNYLDLGNHGWLGWESNFAPAAAVLLAAARTEGATPADVHGFAVNVAGYAVLEEPHFTATTVIGGRPVREASPWVDWNRHVGELTYAQAYRDHLVGVGFDPGIGMLIDTGRNGWGGPGRPTSAGTSTDPATYVEQSRVDRRNHHGNWCNQRGAGLGERPVAAPEPGIDAYAWIKPPGESDGTSTFSDDVEYKGFDRMCDPTYTGNSRNGNTMTGSLPGAPLGGRWFQAQFTELLANAYPPL